MIEYMADNKAKRQTLEIAVTCGNLLLKPLEVLI